MTAAGNESRQQFCLREMGIQTWYSRLALPFAQAHRVPVGIEVVTEVVPSPPEPAPRPVEQLESARVSTTPAADPASPVRPLSSAAEPVATPHFAFAYLSVSDSLAVLAEIPYATRGRLQAPVRALLSRILEALQVPVQSGSTPVIHFQWPLHEEDQLEHGMDNARQTVQGFLTRQLRDRPVPFLLVFSEQWPEYLFPEGFGQPQDGLFAHPRFPVRVLVTRGLQLMLADESVKRPAWKQLQRLKKAMGIVTAGGQ